MTTTIIITTVLTVIALYLIFGFLSLFANRRGSTFEELEERVEELENKKPHYSPQRKSSEETREEQRTLLRNDRDPRTGEIIGSKKRIVHIDDDKFLINMYDTKFQKKGCVVFAIMKFDKHTVDDIAERKPDVIISDIVHDQVDPDGIELCRQIQKDTRLSNVPFVFLSNSLSLLKKENTNGLNIAKSIEKASTKPDEVVDQILQIII